MGLEHLKSIFAQGVGNNATSPAGRHGGTSNSFPSLPPHPPENSRLDDFKAPIQIGGRHGGTSNSFPSLPAHPADHSQLDNFGSSGTSLFTYPSQLGGRHGGTSRDGFPSQPPHPADHSQLDNFGASGTILFNYPSQIGGRHGGTETGFPSLPAHPADHSQLDNFVTTPLITLWTETPQPDGSINFGNFPSYVTTNLIPELRTDAGTYSPMINLDGTSPTPGEYGLLGLGLRLGAQTTWSTLYHSNHTSKEFNDAIPHGENPFQRQQYPGVDNDLNIRDAGPKFLTSFSRRAESGTQIAGVGDQSEPYIVSKIPTIGDNGDNGRLTNLGSRLLPINRPITDVKRITKYLSSAQGLANIAAKNTDLVIASSVVRYVKTEANEDGTKTKKDTLRIVPQRFNNGYNPVSTLAAVGSRVIGQGVPDIKFQSGITPGYPEGNFTTLGTLPKYSLVDTFTAGDVTAGTKGIFGRFFDAINTLDAEIPKTSAGDKMTLAKIITGVSMPEADRPKTPKKDLSTRKGRKALRKAIRKEKVRAFFMGTEAKEDPVPFKVDSEKDGMPFYFKDMRDNSYIFFRAFLEGITENVAPSWAETSYIGKSDNAYVYERTNRDITFTLKLFAQTRKELSSIYEKMNKITSLCYPEYAEDEDMFGKTRMKPPLTKLRIGDYIGKTDNELLGFIESLNYTIPEESTWETEAGARVPKFILATMTYRILHGSVPNMETKFYGYTGEKLGA